MFSTFELDVGVSMQWMFQLYKTEECLIKDIFNLLLENISRIGDVLCTCLAQTVLEMGRNLYLARLKPSVKFARRLNE